MSDETTSSLQSPYWQEGFNPPRHSEQPQSHQHEWTSPFDPVDPYELTPLLRAMVGCPPKGFMVHAHRHGWDVTTCHHNVLIDGSGLLLIVGSGVPNRIEWRPSPNEPWISFPFPKDAETEDEIVATIRGRWGELVEEMKGKSAA